MPERKRGIQINFRVTQRELSLIENKMEQYGTKNMEAYLRKMAIDGYVVRLDLSDVRELISLLRRCSNNINQYTRRAHETGSIYEADVDDIRQNVENLGSMVGQLLTRLSSIE